MGLHIIYEDPGSAGYTPVLHMVRLARELLEGTLTVVRPGRPSLAERLSGLLPARGRDPCLVIAPHPPAMRSLLRVPDWRRRFGPIMVWVFDSFWLNHVPRSISLFRRFDHVFVTEQEDVPGWQATMRTPVTYLPWGSDVLRLGGANAERTVDVQRIGRQPPEWEDDAATARACAERGLAFAGRPPSLNDAAENHRELMRAYARAKFTVSFTNAVSPSVQTHPTREYITGRWVDALAAGATVAGIPPNSDAVRDLLWPEALLDTRSAKLSESLDVIESAAKSWTPARAALNHQRALERLDWRLRFKVIADAFDLRPGPLQGELALLAKRAHTANPGLRG